VDFRSPYLVLFVDSFLSQHSNTTWNTVTMSLSQKRKSEQQLTQERTEQKQRVEEEDEQLLALGEERGKEIKRMFKKGVIPESQQKMISNVARGIFFDDFKGFSDDQVWEAVEEFMEEGSFTTKDYKTMQVRKSTIDLILLFYSAFLAKVECSVCNNCFASVAHFCGECNKGVCLGCIDEFKDELEAILFKDSETLVGKCASCNKNVCKWQLAAELIEERCETTDDDWSGIMDCLCTSGKRGEDLVNCRWIGIENGKIKEGELFCSLSCCEKKNPL
jgi:hypothetical protein